MNIVKPNQYIDELIDGMVGVAQPRVSMHRCDDCVLAYYGKEISAVVYGLQEGIYNTSIVLDDIDDYVERYAKIFNFDERSKQYYREGLVVGIELQELQ